MSRSPKRCQGSIYRLLNRKNCLVRKTCRSLVRSNGGRKTFTHFADGTGHKNRMQGNDFVQSLMYRRGVTCFSCHDVQGTANNADLVKPAKQLCLTCHGPSSPNGPHTATIEDHTHHPTGR